MLLACPVSQDTHRFLFHKHLKPGPAFLQTSSSLNASQLGGLYTRISFSRTLEKPPNIYMDLLSKIKWLSVSLLKQNKPMTHIYINTPKTRFTAVFLSPQGLLESIMGAILKSFPLLLKPSHIHSQIYIGRFPQSSRANFGRVRVGTALEESRWESHVPHYQWSG